MKQLLLCISLLLIILPAPAQDLSLKNLLSYRAMELTQLDKKLSRKGWTFMSDSKPDSAMMGKAVWAYKPQGENAEAWCVLYYNHDSPSRILYYQSSGRAVTKMQQKIRRRQMAVHSQGKQLERGRPIDSYTYYTDEQYIIRIIRYEQSGYAGIKIFKREDYLMAQRNGRL